MGSVVVWSMVACVVKDLDVSSLFGKTVSLRRVLVSELLKEHALEKKQGSVVLIIESLQASLCSERLHTVQHQPRCGMVEHEPRFFDARGRGDGSDPG